MRPFRLTAGFAAAILCALVGLGAPPAHADGDCASVPSRSFPVAAPGNAGDAAAFAGVWEGSWTLQVGMRRNRHPASYCAHLHVAVKDPHSAAVLYCFAALPEANIPARCIQLSANLAASQLTFTTPAGYNYTFTPAGGGMLRGQFVGATRTTNPIVTEFHKLQ